MDSKTFKDLGLSQWLCDTVSQMGFRFPTPIQQQCIPEILKGGSVVGRAQTGSGKTAAFALPMLQALSTDPYGIFGLVLTPTRELAFQIDEQFRAFGVNMGLNTCVVVGGLDMSSQRAELTERPHIVIATPGRLSHHIRNNVEINMEGLQFLVLDEADRLFEDCFDDDLETITSIMPDKSERQTLLFSATMTKKVVEYQKLTMTDPLYLEVHSEKEAIVEALDQKYLLVPQAVKQTYLAYILRQAEWAENKSIIIFTSTCKGCEIVSALLLELSIDCVTLNSSKTQQRRLAALGKFKSGKSMVLVATDVASRGLDIPTVQLVINYDVPRMSEDYVHRVGRTARAGRTGVSITFVSQYDVEIFKSIESFVGKEMDPYKVSEDKVLAMMNEVAQAGRMAKIRTESYETTSRSVKRDRKDGKPSKKKGNSKKKKPKKKKKVQSS